MATAQMEQDAALQREALAAKQPPKKPAPGGKSYDLTADELKDLSLWYSKAKAWHAKNKGNAVDWENKSLREEVAAPIRMKLAEARTEYDIMLAFQMGGETTTDAPEYKTSEIILLADALNNYAAKATEPPAQPIVIVNNQKSKRRASFAKAFAESAFARGDNNNE